MLTQAWTRRHIFLSLLILLSFLTAGIVWAETPKTAPAAASKKDTYTLRSGYKAGQQLRLVQVVAGEATYTVDFGNGAEVRTSYGTLTTEMSVKVSPSDDAGALEMWLAVQRFVMKDNAGGRVREMDSDRPETFPEGRRLSPLLGARFLFSTDGDKANPVSFDPKLLEKPYFAGMSSEASEKAADEFSALLALVVWSPWSYWPSGPVAVGDTWSVEQRVSSVFAMTITMGAPVGPDAAEWPKETVQCSLKEVEKTPRGMIATVEISGKITWPEKLGLGASDLTGTVRFNMDTGELLEHVLNTVMVHGESTARYTLTTTLSPDPASQPTSQPAMRPAAEK